jgi:hypothetical protein
MHEALAQHDALLKEVVTAFQGRIVKTTYLVPFGLIIAPMLARRFLRQPG